jgi:hypothetical protein
MSVTLWSIRIDGSGHWAARWLAFASGASQSVPTIAPVRM